MKKILFFTVLAFAIISRSAAFGAQDPQSVKTLSAWVTYSTDSPEYAKESPSYTLLLQPGGVAYVAANFDGKVIAKCEGTWRIEGKKIVFTGLSICDSVTGEKATYKSAVVKSGDGEPYLVVKTSVGTRYFITL